MENLDDIMMDNGVSVASWLGTASSAAMGAVHMLDRARLGTINLQEDLDEADRKLEQATDELQQIRMKLIQERIINAPLP